MIYKKLLIPLDGSQISETVLPYARVFARALHIPTEFLEVIDPEVMRCPPNVPRGRSEISKRM
jgi:nucleotide-binding universal stress UspA family protein